MHHLHTVDELERMIKSIEEKLKKKLSIPQQLISFVLIFFVFITICAYISYLMGSRYFLLPHYKGENIILVNGISFILYAINLFLMIGVCCNLNIKKTIIATGLFMFCVFLPYQLLFQPSIIITILIPALYIGAISLKFQCKKGLLIFLFLGVFFFAYDIIIIPIKCGTSIWWGETYKNLSIFSRIFASIDVYLILSSLWLYRKELNKNGLGLVSILVSSVCKDDEAIDPEKQQVINDLNRQSSFNKFRTIVNVLLFNIFQFFIIAGLAHIGSVLIECIVISITFVASSLVIKRKWHSNSILICTISSAVIFYIASKVTIPFHYSMFFPIVIAVLMSIMSAFIAFKQKEYADLKTELFILKTPKSFKCNMATPNEFLARCYEKGLTESEIEFAIKSLSSNRLTTKELSVTIKSGYDEGAIRVMKHRMRKRLES